MHAIAHRRFNGHMFFQAEIFRANTYNDSLGVLFETMALVASASSASVEGPTDGTFIQLFKGDRADEDDSSVEDNTFISDCYELMQGIMEKFRTSYTAPKGEDDSTVIFEALAMNSQLRSRIALSSNELTTMVTKLVSICSKPEFKTYRITLGCPSRTGSTSSLVTRRKACCVHLTN